MRNDIYKKYSEKVFNKEENFEKIILNSKKKKIRVRKIFNIAAVILIIFAVGLVTPEIYANIKYNKEFKEYSQRDYEIEKGAISDKIEDGYLEKVNMDYLKQDGIKIKEYFEKLKDLEILKNKAKLVVLGDYEAKSKYNISNV